MEFKEAAAYLVNNFAATMAAIIAVAAFIGVIKPIGQSVKRFFFRELYEANDRQDKRIDGIEMWQLKQIICDRRLPDGERLKAAKEYIRRGGNGEIAMIYEADLEVAKKNRVKERERREQEQTDMRGKA
jgi:uncharacterized membrane protein